MYQLVHYSYHNVPLEELVGTLWKIIYQLIHYGNIIAFQNQSYLQIRLEKCLISHQYNVPKGILKMIISPQRRKPFIFYFFRRRIRDGRVVPSENVCHMLGIQSHIPEIVVALSDRVRVRVRQISGIFSPFPDIWHTFSLGTSRPSRFRPQRQHLSTP